MSRGARIALAVLAVLVVALVVVVVALVEHVGEGDSTGTKRVTPEGIKRFDAAVVLPKGASAFAVAAVEDDMNRLGAVSQYAEVPHRTLTYVLSLDDNVISKALVTRACAEPTTRGYVVVLAQPTPDAQRQLASALGDNATVRPSSYQPPPPEIFMEVKATDEQNLAVKERLDRDPDVTKVRFLDHADAYAEFKRLFEEQPELLKSEPADGSGLPQSYRLDLRAGASAAAVAARFRNLPGVDTVHLPPQTILPGTPLSDPCERD